MVLCGHCKKEGHNRRTCPVLVASRSPGSVNKSRPAATKGAKKKKLSDIQLPNREQSELKLKTIKSDRIEQYNISIKSVQTLIEGKNVMVKAEEKTGKRCILEAIHLMMISLHYSSVPEKREKPPRSVYITALNRKDTKVQFEEQENEYGILSISTQFGRLLGDIINILNEPGNDGMIYLHIDECDYGSGDEQALSKLYNAPELKLSRNKERIKFIAYSATPEELEFSGLNPDEWEKHIFTPSPTYCGAQWYLNNKLVFPPSTFFDGKNITEHGEGIIREVQSNCLNEILPISSKLRNVIVVRVPPKGILSLIREKKSEIEGKYSCDVYIFDQSDGFEWGSQEKWGKLGKEEIRDGNETIIECRFKPVLIFISQICTRSTEICPLGHRKIYAWHDARKLEDRKAYNTLSQAIGRVKHYKQKDYPENKIKLFCDKDILNYTVGNPVETTTLILGSRVKSLREKQSKVQFIGYQDGYESSSDVPDAEWQQGDPTVGLEGNEITFHEIDGKWCQWDKRLRIWGDKNHGGSGGDAGRQRTLQYEDTNSERYIVRTALYQKREIEEEQGNTFTHETKSNSMYVSDN